MKEKLAQQPVKTHQYKGKIYLTLDGVEELLSLLEEEIRKSLLTDEEIGDLLALEDLVTVHAFPCSDGSSIITMDCRPVAQAQLDKVLRIVEEK